MWLVVCDLNQLQHMPILLCTDSNQKLQAMGIFCLELLFVNTAGIEIITLLIYRLSSIHTITAA